MTCIFFHIRSASHASDIAEFTSTYSFIATFFCTSIPAGLNISHSTSSISFSINVSTLLIVAPVPVIYIFVYIPGLFLSTALISETIFIISETIIGAYSFPSKDI